MPSSDADNPRSSEEMSKTSILAESDRDKHNAPTATSLNAVEDTYALSLDEGNTGDVTVSNDAQRNPLPVYEIDKRNFGIVKETKPSANSLPKMSIPAKSPLAKWSSSFPPPPTKEPSANSHTATLPPTKMRAYQQKKRPDQQPSPMRTAGIDLPELGARNMSEIPFKVAPVLYGLTSAYEVESTNAESVFSTNRALTTSQRSADSTSIIHDAINQVAILFMAEKSFAPLFFEALKSPNIESEMFAKWLIALLEKYGLDLKEEAGLESQRRVAADLVIFCAGNIAEKICEACHTKAQMECTHFDGQCLESDNAKPDLESTHGNEDPGYLTHIYVVEDFLMKGEPFQTLQAGLQDLVTPSWQYGARVSLDYISEEKRRDGWLEEDLYRSRALLDDLQFVEPHDIAFHTTIELSKLEKVQLHVESYTQAHWLWWPLRRPRKVLRKGYCYMTWQGVGSFAQNVSVQKS